MALAKDLEGADPKIALKVIQRSSSQIKARVRALTFHKDSDSDYSAKLERMEEKEHE